MKAIQEEEAVVFNQPSKLETLTSYLQLPFLSTAILLSSSLFTFSSPSHSSSVNLTLQLSYLFALEQVPQFSSYCAHLLFHSSYKMADLDSSTVDNSVDSREQNSPESKIGFSEDEEKLINVMYSLVGERWSLIAGRIPGRTAEEIEKYWTSRCSASQ